MLTYDLVDGLSDEQLVLAAQSGDERAMEGIIARYRSFVSATVSGYYAIGFDKEDIVQEGMIGLYKAVLDYNPEKAGFRSFARLCILRRVFSLLKFTSRQKNVPQNLCVSLDSDEGETKASEVCDPEALLINKEDMLGYIEKINAVLSPFELQVLSYYVDKLSYKDISKILGKDIKSVDNAVQRIKKKLGAIK